MKAPCLDLSRLGARMTNVLRRILLRLYYSPAVIYRSPFCREEVQISRLQFVVIGLPGVGKTMFCLKACNSSDAAILAFMATDQKSQSMLPFSHQYGRRFSLSPTTIINYIEIGGKEPMSESKRNSTYAQSHGVILLIDLTFYPCQAKSIEFLHSALDNQFLMKKPILVVGSKLDRCLQRMDTVKFIEAFDLKYLATEAKTRMLAMTMGRKTKKSEISQNMKWYIRQVLEDKDEMNERIENDLEILRKVTENEEKKEEVLLMEKLLDNTQLAARLKELQYRPELQRRASTEDFDEMVTFYPDSSDLSAYATAEILTPMVDSEGEDRAGSSQEQGRPESDQEVETGKDEGEWEPTGIKGMTYSGREVEPSWIEELDESESTDSTDAYCRLDTEEVVAALGFRPKAKSLNDLDPEPWEIPLHRARAAENLLFVDEEGDGRMDFRPTAKKTTSDPVYPFTKFEISEIEFGPDFFSSTVLGGGEPEESTGQLPQAPPRNESGQCDA